MPTKLVKDIMTPVTKIISVKEETPLTEVANVLFQHNFNGLPVVNAAGELRGLVSERDLIIGGQNIYLPTFLQLLDQFEFAGKKDDMPEEFKKLAQITVGQIMITRPFTVHPQMPIEELAKIMAENHINPVPVVELGKLVGIASRSDLVKMLAPSRLNEKPRDISAAEMRSPSAEVLEPLFRKATVRLEKGFIIVDRLRVRLWWVFLFIAFVIGFFVSIAWIIRLNI